MRSTRIAIQTNLMEVFVPPYLSYLLAWQDPGGQSKTFYVCLASLVCAEIFYGNFHCFGLTLYRYRFDQWPTGRVMLHGRLLYEKAP